MGSIKLNYNHLVKEQRNCNDPDRFSHPAFTRKVPKGATICDYDKSEKKIELEYSTGNRFWFDLSLFFGTVITEDTIYMFYPDSERLEELTIAGVEQIKVKRTLYWKLIFERDLPF